MIELRRNKLTIITLKIKPEELTFIFKGKLQEITDFKIKPKSDNIDIDIEINLKELLYIYQWGHDE